jgi:hypothetical protein
MVEKLPCPECPLRSIENADRTEVCRDFLQGVLHQWWHGNPTIPLHDVAGDELRFKRDEYSEGEIDLIYNCLAEHSSTRCDNLNPY